MSDVTEVRDEEALFSRDLDGRLVRAKEATIGEFNEIITIEIDGMQVKVPRAQPATDAQGNILRDADGQPIPRATTIYDAATELYVKQKKGTNPIPLLCHQQHMKPVAACRVCVVEICKVKTRDGKTDVMRERKLLPACQHRVEPTMQIHTVNSKNAEARKRVRDAVGLLTELLAADHLPPPAEEPVVAAPPRARSLFGMIPLPTTSAPARPRSLAGSNPGERPRSLAGGRPSSLPGSLGGPAGNLPLPGRRTTSLSEGTKLRPVSQVIESFTRSANQANELDVLAARMGISTSRFTRGTHDRGKDESSLTINVDHNNCILCDRCVRACNEVKKNEVIGRSGKGYTTKIAFDLGDPMGQSSCVSCGECMVSCPTGALTFKQFVRPEVWKDEKPAPEVVKADELRNLRVNIAGFENYPLFETVSYKFLQWNEGSVVRRRVRKGDVLCHEGEYGFSAFIILKGKFEISLRNVAGKEIKKKGLFGRFSVMFGGDDSRDGGRALPLRATGTAAVDSSKRLAIVGPEDLIVGEMTCMNNYPRSATVTAMEDGEVLEILRNVLYTLQRNKVSRELFEQIYRSRALGSHLQKLKLFADLPTDQRNQIIDYLKPRVEFVRVDPGQTIFEQNEPADHFYLVRLGYVKISQRYFDQETVLNYLGPGDYFGEIGLLSGSSEWVAMHLPRGARRGVRTASATALDHVELVRIRGDAFRNLIDQYPALEEALVKQAEQWLQAQENALKNTKQSLNSFVEQGLFQANSLLVLDLTKCTRCDECTKACSDTHQGVTRLIREGLRFDRFLVATSCRSCQDPYCMVGCPVDAIHRRRDSREIQIEDHCIGCGLCANNCPYGNIQMIEQLDRNKAAKRKATTCDLCEQIVGPNEDTSCVYACPHDAAHRMSGQSLRDLVESQRR